MLAALTELKLGPQLAADGHTIYFGNNERLDCTTGQGQFNRNREVSEIKRAYSAAVVTATARKFGWAPAKENTKQEFVFTRRC